MLNDAFMTVRTAGIINVLENANSIAVFTTSDI